MSATGLLDAAPNPDTRAPFEPFPLVVAQSSSGLAFDLAGSEERKLRFELSEPLIQGATTELRWLNLVGTDLAAGATVDWEINEDLSFGADVMRQQSQYAFQTLGSIHCENGILEAGSYHASNCYFVNEANDLDIGSIRLGANFEINDNAAAALNLFRRESSLLEPAVRRRGSLGGTPVLDAGLLTPVLANPLLPQWSPGQPLSSLDTEVTGIDLELAVGVSTGRAGDLRLGLQLTRILEGDYEGFYPDGSGLQSWKVIEPFDSARMSFDWTKGAFSGGIQSFYREPVEFLNHDTLDRVTTFDVYFTWRTPWNGSLSVGATNLLNSGGDETSDSENRLADPFESIYGRIPYVRYKQDL